MSMLYQRCIVFKLGFVLSKAAPSCLVIQGLHCIIHKVCPPRVSIPHAPQLLAWMWVSSMAAWSCPGSNVLTVQCAPSSSPALHCLLPPQSPPPCTQTYHLALLLYTTHLTQPTDCTQSWTFPGILSQWISLEIFRSVGGRISYEVDGLMFSCCRHVTRRLGLHTRLLYYT